MISRFGHGPPQEAESCQVCGGDGRIMNSFGGSTKTCPACHGTGRRSFEPLLRDVTKTKPSHYAKAKSAPAEKPTWPSTGDGAKLGAEVRDCPYLSNDTKARLIREIIEYEGSHGVCTQTFSRKVRKQLKGPTAK
jgi:RecJ-like exonuclease